MIPLREFLDITSIIKTIKDSSLNIARRSMPQIHNDKTDDFLEYLKKQNINYKRISVNPENFRASQNQFNNEKIIAMFESGFFKKLADKPILVSKDNYIIDGHHRWVALYLNNVTNKVNRKMNTITINMNAKPLIDVMKNYDAVDFKKVKEGLNHDKQTKQLIINSIHES